MVVSAGSCDGWRVAGELSGRAAVFLELRPELDAAAELGLERGRILPRRGLPEAGLPRCRHRRSRLHTHFQLQ
jgi:hypothetical protein